MTKLFLTSAGLVPETYPGFLKPLGKDPEGSRLVYVPTASDPEPDKSYADEDTKRLSDIGFLAKNIDLKDKSEELLNKELSDADIVYVQGGNTFYLLDWVRKSGFDKAIKKFLGRGGLYIGVSAGSMVAGVNIETAGWKYADRNIVNLKDLTAMELVPFAIAPHINVSNVEATKNEAAKVSYPVIALTDAQAVVVDGPKTEVIGPGEKLIFNNSEFYKS